MLGVVAVGEEREVGEVHDARAQRAQRGQQPGLAQGERRALQAPARWPPAAVGTPKTATLPEDITAV